MFCTRMKKKLRIQFITLALAALFLPLQPMARAEGGLTLAVGGKVRPYKDQAIEYQASEAGVLTLTLSDGFMVPYVIFEGAVDKGAGSIPWNGLLAAGEPLPRGRYTLTAALRSDRATYEAETDLTASTPICAVMFGLPSTRVLRRGESMTFEYCLSAEGSFRLEILDESGALVRRWNIRREGLDASRVTWDGEANGKPVPAGVYTARFSVPQSDTPAIERTVTVLDEPATSDEVRVSQDYMPLDPADPEALWRALMAPVVVAEGGYTQHVRVLDAPNGSKVGEIHARTQAVCVFEIEGGWARVGCWRHEDGAYIEGYISLSKLYTVTPNDEYGIVIDKQTQTMTIYRDKEAVTTMTVATGLMAKNKLFRETRAGAFLTADRFYDFRSEGFRYRYALRIDGGNLMHEMGHVLREGAKPDFAAQLPAMGTKASQGCVRMPNKPTEEGMNAYWVWTNIPPTVKVLVLDDREARDARMRQLDPNYTESSPSPFERAMPATPTPVPTPAPTMAPVQPATEDTVVLTLAGDCVIGGEEKTRALENSFDSTVTRLGYEWPFSGVAELFTTDDMTFVNLECCFKDDKRDRAEKTWNFRAPTDFARILTLGSVEQVNLANNHFIDYGPAGRRTTIAALEAANVAYSGYRELHTFEKAGLKIGFGGIRETTFRQNNDIMREDIQALKDMGCDVIIFSCHFGDEYAVKRTELQQCMAYAAIDWGADIVVGTHPHVVQGIEQYHDGLIFFSLGNFTFGGNLELTVFDGLALRLTLKREQTTARCDVRLIPVAITGSVPANDFRPVPLPYGDAFNAVMQKIQYDSPAPVQETFTHWIKLDEK